MGCSALFSRRSRVLLVMKAVILRVLMRIGMLFHGYPLRGPAPPHFTRKLRSRSPSSETITLHFYTPKDFFQTSSQEVKYPVVVNFHGGGFCLGRATDDARWAQIVTETANAVVVCVDYRLAPENPFPAAVEDGVDALLYIQEHASEFNLDINRVSLTGFSAGGNLAFAIPLRLLSLSKELNHADRNGSVSSSMQNLSRPNIMRHNSDHKLLSRTNTRIDLKIVSIIAWYPILDFVLPREIRRNRCVKPEKALPPFLTSLFDNSYVPDHVDRSSPYASPIHASDHMLAEALPTDVFIYMCEWDMLLREGQEFVQRLEQQGKKVRSMMIEQSKHAWDKSVNPFRNQGRIDVFYLAAAEHMRNIFEREDEGGEQAN